MGILRMKDFKLQSYVIKFPKIKGGGGSTRHSHQIRDFKHLNIKLGGQNFNQGTFNVSILQIFFFNLDNLETAPGRPAPK